MRKYLSLVLGVIIVVLEILPYGAALSFASPDGAVVNLTRYYSYFSIIPFGYANFGPLITAIFTSVAFLLTIIGLFVKARGLVRARLWIYRASFITSLTPLIMFCSAYFTLLGLGISCLILLNCIIIRHSEQKK
jgi:hypothetical protein